jgi:hypothetical protein
MFTFNSLISDPGFNPGVGYHKTFVFFITDAVAESYGVCPY